MSDKNLTILQFIESRIDESEKATEGLRLETIQHLRLMFDSMRVILEMHKQWPILLETEPEFTAFDDYDPKDPTSVGNNLTYKMTKNFEFVVYQAYVDRFGHEPPTTPMLRQLATVWSHHPDFQDEWLSN